MIENLNSQQQRAVQSADGCTAIIAGPGTGKTLTFAHRLVYLLRIKEVQGRNILALTFIRSAAREMKERVRKLLQDSPLKAELEQIWIETFHAAALRILREQSYSDWSLISEEEKTIFLKGLVPAKEIPNFLEELKTQKQQLLPPANKIAQEYQQRLFAAKKIDFDDLFILTIQLFEEKLEVLSHYKEQFQNILVDEFQDTSFAQYQFLKCLATENLCVLGDPDQAIYNFTSKNFAPFEQFKKDYPSAQFYLLSENYRSQSTILQAAKEVIEKNPTPLPRELSAKLEKGLPIEILSFQTDLQEAEMVVKKIESLLGGTSFFTMDTRWATAEEESVPYGLNDIALLYRLHGQAHLLKKVLERSGIPCRIFAKNKKTEDEPSLSEDLEDFQNNEKGLEGEGITLMTLHCSKGLEFPVVFILGCEEGILPAFTSPIPSLSPDAWGASKRGMQPVPSKEEGSRGCVKEVRVEEERRLFYVGMTRAKNRLFLSYAKKRFLFGRKMESEPSRFIAEFQEELRKLQRGEISGKRRDPRKNQLQLFAPHP